LLIIFKKKYKNNTLIKILKINNKKLNY